MVKGEVMEEGQAAAAEEDALVQADAQRGVNWLQQQADWGFQSVPVSVLARGKCEG